MMQEDLAPQQLHVFVGWIVTQRDFVRGPVPMLTSLIRPAFGWTRLQTEIPAGGAAGQQ